MRYVVLVLCIIKRFHTLRTAMIRYDFEFVRQKNSFFVEVEWMNKSVDNVAETQLFASWSAAIWEIIKQQSHITAKQFFRQQHNNSYDTRCVNITYLHIEIIN